jgi:hypothetical protein
VESDIGCGWKMMFMLEWYCGFRKLLLKRGGGPDLLKSSAKTSQTWFRVGVAVAVP